MDKLSKQEIKILRAAKTIFFRDGFEGAKTQEIADKAKVNKALLHYYFRSKEGLFEKVAAKAFLQFSMPFASLNNEEKSFLERLDQFILQMVDLTRKEPALVSFIIQAMQHQPELLPARFSEQLVVEDFIQTMKNGAKQGFLRVQDVEAAWLTVLSMLLGAALLAPLAERTLTNPNESLERYFQALPNQIKGILIG